MLVPSFAPADSLNVLSISRNVIGDNPRIMATLSLDLPLCSCGAPPLPLSPTLLFVSIFGARLVPKPASSKLKPLPPPKLPPPNPLPKLLPSLAPKSRCSATPVAVEGEGGEKGEGGGREEEDDDRLPVRRPLWRSLRGVAGIWP